MSTSREEQACSIAHREAEVKHVRRSAKQSGIAHTQCAEETMLEGRYGVLRS